MAEKVIVRLCATCPAPSGQGDIGRLEAAIAAAGLTTPVEVLTQDCMNGCATPVLLALQGAGRATCFFGGIDPGADRDDIVATLRAYIDSPAGWIDDARACGRLRYCLIGRVPALPPA